jgi:hypothetical protein
MVKEIEIGDVSYTKSKLRVPVRFKRPGQEFVSITYLYFSVSGQLTRDALLKRIKDRMHYTLNVMPGRIEELKALTGAVVRLEDAEAPR